ncbi:MAG TPA: symmetrical bis(5'-nucleosyl)-tetraphosphatase [Usitatibacter sp.]
MATYAIGDLQGCYEPLARLVDSLRFDPARDKLWFVGDLVNRGPDSLACLRFVKALGDAAVTVLGNHDLHLLCVAEGVQKVHKRDTLQDVLAAPDRDELLAWLRSRPLMHVEGSFALVHAGLLPQWTVPRARELAHEVEGGLRASGYRAFMAKMYGNEPDRWDKDLAGIDRLRVIVNAMTRMRVCTPDGRMALDYKGEPGETHGAMIPWFDMPRRKSADHTLVVGHWSALGLLERTDVLALDTGCVWGRTLSAVRLEDRKVFQRACSA